MAPITTAHGIGWDPVKVLGLDIGDTIQCHGTRKDGHRCRNPVGKQWHREMFTELAEVRLLQPGSISEQDLAPLAHSLLCLHWHRGAQDHQLSSQWYREIVRFNKTGVPMQDHKPRANDQQLAAAQAATDKALEITAKLMGQLQDAQKRLANADMACDSLERANKRLLSSQKQVETERDYAESRIRRLDTEMIDQKEQHEQDVNAMKHGHEENVKDIQNQHNDEKKIYKSDAKTMRRTLQAKDRLLEDSVQELGQQSYAHATREQKLREENKKLRTKLNFEALRSHVKLLTWQRKNDALKADNETLLQQQKCLQQVASGIDGELQAMQVRETRL